MHTAPESSCVAHLFVPSMPLDPVIMMNGRSYSCKYLGKKRFLPTAAAASIVSMFSIEVYVMYASHDEMEMMK